MARFFLARGLHACPPQAHDGRRSIGTLRAVKRSHRDKDVTIEEQDTAKASATDPTARQAGADPHSISTTFGRDGDAESLRLSEERFRLLVEHAVDDFFLHDDKGCFLDVNQRACTSTGYSREELLRMRVTDLTVAHTPDEVQRILDGTQPGDASTVLARHRRKDGSEFPVEVRISCLLIDGRKVFLGMARDISERVEAERAIRELNAQLERRAAASAAESRKSASLLQAVMDAAPDLIYVKDRNGRYLFVNSATSKLMGRTQEDILGRGDEEIFPADLARQLALNDRLVITDGAAHEIEEKPVRDGVSRTYRSNKAPYRDEQGRIIGLIGISRDVTEMLKAEAALRHTEARWQFALDGSGDGIWDWDLRSGQVFYSRQWKAMLGYAEDEVGISVSDWSDRVHPDDLPRCWEIVNRHLRGETPDFTLEHRMRAKDGSWHWIHDRGKVIERGTDGAPLRVVGTHTDITLRKESEEAIRQLNQRLQLANRVSGVGVWELPDPQAAQFFWDEQMHALYGLAFGAFDGSLDQWMSLLHADDVTRVLDEWNAALAGPGVPFFHTEFRIVRSDGEQRHIRAQARIFRAEDGSVQRALGVNWDITAARLAAEGMQRAKEAAEAAERAKGEFLAMMSHEIRTPMNAVLGMTRLALQTELAPKQRNYLDKVNASAQTLITIINNILDFSKIEAGKLELEEAEFTLESVLESVSSITAIKAEEKGLEIVYSIAAGVPARLIGDSLRLGQVLINLVNNAIKFTARGEVVVSIEAATRHADGRVTLGFSVSDTGIGLDADQIAGLFHAFWQADSHVSRHYGGTGLGLVICKQLVELMGGRIGVSSTPGEGSIFRFTIDAREPAGALRRPAELAGIRVLVVDDNATARDVLAQMLQGFGMRVGTAESGGAALRKLQGAASAQHPFELVLMDWQMPGMDGLETARQMRATPGLQKMPALLMVTAYGREEVLRRAERLGLRGVLVKPVTASTLFETVSGSMGNRPAGEAVRTGVTKAAASGMRARPAPETLAGRRILVVDDNQLNREVASGFLLGAGMRVDTATDGRDALEHLRRSDYDAVLMDIHMPGMDGLAAAREIRKQPRWAGLPIIALTARTRAEDRESSTAAGMNGHLTKPIDEATLYSALLQVLPPSPSRQDPARTRPVPANTGISDGTWDLPVPATQLDIPAALEHLGGQRELLSRLLRGFVQDFHDAAAQLVDDQRGAKFDAVAARAHAVRGAASYLHADSLCQIATQLEDAARHGLHDAVAQLTTHFAMHLDAVLAEIAHMLSREPAIPAERRSGDAVLVLSLVDTVEPLISSGDYAARALLEEIASHAPDPPLAALAEAARLHFDRLELDQTQEALQRLRSALESRAGGGSFAP
jgi:two-component system sensor histidine kinase/response regulator